jgi:hypothetical protein
MVLPSVVEAPTHTLATPEITLKSGVDIIVTGKEAETVPQELVIL